MVKAKLMMALRDPESVESLMTLAVQLSNGMDAELIVLHVVEVPPATPSRRRMRFWTRREKRSSRLPSGLQRDLPRR